MTRLKGRELEHTRPDGVDEDAVVTVLRVPPEAAGQRVDVFLQSQLRRTSRTRAQWILKVSAYDRDGRKLRPGSRVRAEQWVCLWRAPWDETPVPTEIPVLYEDEHLLAVHKPPKLPVHPTARYHKNTLIKLLEAERPGQWLSLGHRLDRETSGVILIPKHPACDRALKKMLEARDGVEKIYEAITWGVPEHPEHPGDRAFRVERSMKLDGTASTNVMMCISDDEDALWAATRFHVTHVSADGRYARVRCFLETGRQHQIRVHLAHLGTPIVGDKLYGPDDRMFAREADGELTEEDAAKLELPRHALHAARLELAHPITGEALAIEAPLPDDLSEFWERVR
jgi:23S rRNA pseudouridine1911/1915/1917 synthase